MLEPRDESELAEAIAGAAGSLNVIGGGTRGVRTTGAEVLSARGLSGISRYEPGALTLVAGAGTPLAEIEEALAAEGQRLPFEPMDHRGLTGREGAPTIGGIVAANVSGPRRVQAGACRDALLGVRFIDGRGDVIKNGGRVMKNVTGYDLVKLMAGSFGTLGVLSEVSLKLLPGAETCTSVRLQGLDDRRAVAAMAAALGSPFEVSGAAHRGDLGVTSLRLEGLAASVAYRAERLADMLGRFGDVSVEATPEAVAAEWAAIRDVAPFQGAPGDLWRLSAKPSEAPGLVARAGGEALYDWGGGLVWLCLPPGTDLRARLGAFSGHATLVRGEGFAMFHPEPPALARLSAGLRAQFDPRGILNPGLMG